MPKLPEFLLRWDELQQLYALNAHDQLIQRFRPEDEKLWRRWLEEHATFSFQSPQGRITVRKELRKRGSGYWYAYHTSGRHTRKRYLGQADSVTFERLADIARQLILSFRAVEQTKEEAPASLPQDALLLTKLRIPPLAARLIERTRLLKVLERSLERPLTLLVAPAGYGKTTLVLQWLNLLEEANHPAIAWISLAAEDNDPLRFWRYVVVACQNLPGASPALVQLATSLEPSCAPLEQEALLTALLNALTALSANCVLILENFHIVKSAELQASIAFFIEHLPPALHLLILTRSLPALPLARLGAAGKLSKIATEDLRFSREETLAFLQQNMPQAYDEPTKLRSVESLQGWPAGLRLLTLAQQAGTRQPQIIGREFGRLESGYELIFEYFVSEIFSTQPEPVQDFLLQTCLPTRLSGELCAYLTGREESALLLAELEQANLFLERLGEPEPRLSSPSAPLAQTWYGYFPLFASSLQYIACQRYGEKWFRQLLQRAMNWYEQCNMLTEAIELAIVSSDDERAAELIEQFLAKQRSDAIPSHLLPQQDVRLLQHWLEHLSPQKIEQRPQLRLLQVRVQFFISIMEQQSLSARDLAQLEQALQSIEKSFQDQDDRFGLLWTLFFRAVIERQYGSLEQAVQHARQLLAYAPTEDVLWQHFALQVIGTEELYAGKIECALQTILTSRTLCAQLDAPPLMRGNTALLSRAYYEHGELRLATEHYRQLLNSARQDGDCDDIADAQLGLAYLSYERNELSEAEQQASEALALGEQLGNAQFQVEAALILARIEQARGRSAAAQQRCLQLLTQYPMATVQGLSPGYRLNREIQMLQAWLQLIHGDIASVEHWVSQRDQLAEARPLQREREELLIVRLLLAQRQNKAALEKGMHAAEAARGAGCLRITLQARLLVALAYAANNQRQEARKVLRDVVAAASSEGYQRLFLDEGEALASLLQAILPSVHDGLQSSYLQHLLRAFAQQRTASNAPRAADLNEPLSLQEQRVLHLLISGYTNPQIADELIVSVNTVKAQIQSIYRKLNVHNRVEASEVARQLNLL
ncbi:LuxR C-terminal-related transcriptional regulator [Ktedonosporobacter rubrisoli]|nr:LuxR C-terminal-related transcriptional regulator [Ktedonosporobacter rubrisoli]